MFDRTEKSRTVCFCGDNNDNALPSLCFVFHYRTQERKIGARDCRKYLYELTHLATAVCPFADVLVDLHLPSRRGKEGAAQRSTEGEKLHGSTGHAIDWWCCWCRCWCRCWCCYWELGAGVVIVVCAGILPEGHDRCGLLLLLLHFRMVMTSI